MILSFECKETEKVFHHRTSRRFPSEIHRMIQRKLVMLDAAPDLRSLRVPPGNRLEALTGDREGAHSIRINDRWRLVFVWRNGNAFNVEVVDYHG